MNQVNRLKKAEVFMSCTEEKFFSQETMVQKNTLVRIISGEMRVVQANGTRMVRAGDTILYPRHQLIRVTKYPIGGSPYKSVAIHLNQESLKTYYAHYHQPASVRQTTSDILLLDYHPLLESLFSSLLPYFALSTELPPELAQGKVQEAIAILHIIDSTIDGVLGRFDEPGKIDLVDFMEKNYMFNLPIERFGYLTGRSLATFKRDFKKAFQTTPQRWLTQKRLALAHRLIAEEQRKPTDVYFDAGFENLSHFSFAFKKHYGYSPTHLLVEPLNKASLSF